MLAIAVLPAIAGHSTPAQPHLQEDAEQGVLLDLRLQHVLQLPVRPHPEQLAGSRVGLRQLHPVGGWSRGYTSASQCHTM